MGNIDIGQGSKVVESESAWVGVGRRGSARVGAGRRESARRCRSLRWARGLLILFR